MQDFSFIQYFFKNRNFKIVILYSVKIHLLSRERLNFSRHPSYRQFSRYVSPLIPLQLIQSSKLDPNYRINIRSILQKSFTLVTRSSTTMKLREAYHYTRNAISQQPTSLNDTFLEEKEEKNAKRNHNPEIKGEERKKNLSSSIADRLNLIRRKSRVRVNGRLEK